MVFGNEFEDFLRRDRPYGESRKNSSTKGNSISYEEFKELKEKASKLDKISEQFGDLKSENQELKQKLEAQTKKIEEWKNTSEKYLNTLKQRQADFENYKKRIERDQKNYKQYIAQDILKKMASHYDDLLRAEKIIDVIENDDSVKQGFDMIVKNFKKMLSEEGVDIMDCEGDQFNPYKHEAMMVEERDDLPNNTILEVFDNGYYYKDKVLRPAKVKISKLPSKSNSKPNQDNNQDNTQNNNKQV